MTKITKLMLTLALLVAGVGGVKAGKLYADLSKLGNGPVSTWDGTTNTMTWTATSNNMISNFNFAAGNYKDCSTISITVSDLSNAVGIRLQIKANGQEKLVALNGNGTFTKYLTDDFGFTASDLAKVEWIRVLGSAWQNSENNTIDADHPASAVISDVYLSQPTRTLDVNLSNMAASEGEATWNFSTKTFAWTLTYSNAITLPGLSGNLSSFTTVNFETSAGTCDHFRILIYYSNGAAQTTYYASVGNKSVTFEEMGVATENLSSIASIKISGASDATGDISLNRFWLEGPLVNYIEETKVQVAPEGVTDLNGMTGADNNKWSIAYPLTVGDGTQFGGDIDKDTKSVDITAYDYLLFVVSDASTDAKTGLRVFVSTESRSDNNSRVTLYAHPIADYSSVSDWTAQSFITASGIFVVKISDYPLLRGIKNLAYWQGSAGTIVISQAYVGSGSPVAPTESTVVAGVNALTDANATCFDVTSLTETGLSYNPANPNALFIANSGQMTNANNVIVGTTCANLVLTDGYAFKAPKDFTATAASYATTINSDAQAGTLCLPFTATLPENVKAYTLAYVSGDAASATAVESTIPANTPVLLNGSGAQTFAGSGAVSASAANQSGALTGVFEATTVPEGSYVLQNGAQGLGFYMVASSDIIAKPFRAYLSAESAPARLGIDFGDNTTTAITATAATAVGSTVYDLQGRRVESSTPKRGIYVKGGKKVVIK